MERLRTVSSEERGRTRLPEEMGEVACEFEGGPREGRRGGAKLIMSGYKRRRLTSSSGGWRILIEGQEGVVYHRT
jgi:hypothetical protein